ncbi:hypothetical protein LWI29_031510 [Acer saccharum]|uniref:Potassium transporter n=1 Tax=Acer saccharum TaxID=4024 RepID=A0AA39RJY8_ACESA|nr:hypothetical protein LWI29_031510 [Acer saccharum]
MDRKLDGEPDSVAILSVVDVESLTNDTPNGRLHLLHTDPANTLNPSKKNKLESRRETLIMAYKTLGVVFGGLVTSPLYVYPSMLLKSPTEDDYLGIYSIMFWTLTLIGVVKYATIALKADDQGEGMCMLIGDGILTPAISVLSAMDGIRAPFPSVSKSLVEALSAIVLIFLFLLQKFGTSRVSFLFSPIMGAWTLTTPLVGIYSIIHHYPGIFKALSPHYIVHFFWRNGKEGWLLLGGTVLCITGPIYWPMFIIATSAAIVASQSLISATFSIIKQSVVMDYFPRVKVVHTSSRKEGEVYSPEVNYILMVLCVAVILIFGDGKDIGYAFGVVVSLVMLITTILLTLVMILIWRTPAVLVALYFLVFFTMEGVYVSAVFTKIPEGGWIPFAISFFLAFIMFGWFYGRHRKIEYELTHKIDLGRLRILLSDPGVQRVPGLCFFYTNIQDGLTPILGHYIKNMRSLHRVTIFTTLRYLLVPKVSPQERIVVKKMGLKGVYGCVIQYGYADSLSLEGDDFINQVTDCLRKHIQIDKGRLPSNPVEIQEEIFYLEEAKRSGVVHIRGKTRFYIGKNCSWFDRIMLAFYEVMHSNCRSALPALGVPLPQCIEVGMLYEA